MCCSEEPTTEPRLKHSALGRRIRKKNLRRQQTCFFVCQLSTWLVWQSVEVLYKQNTEQFHFSFPLIWESCFKWISLFQKFKHQKRQRAFDQILIVFQTNNGNKRSTRGSGVSGSRSSARFCPGRRGPLFSLFEFTHHLLKTLFSVRMAPGLE